MNDLDWLYCIAVTKDIAILRRITHGNKEAQTALDNLCHEVSELRKATSNAIHAKCFGSTFDLEQAQEALMPTK